MRSNDIQDENFGKEIEEPKNALVETPWVIQAFGLIMAACISSIIVALTIRLDKWIIH